MITGRGRDTTFAQTIQPDAIISALRLRTTIRRCRPFLRKRELRSARPRSLRYPRASAPAGLLERHRHGSFQGEADVDRGRLPSRRAERPLWIKTFSMGSFPGSPEASVFPGPPERGPVNRQARLAPPVCAQRSAAPQRSRQSTSRTAICRSWRPPDRAGANAHPAARPRSRASCN
jgi:hypothetical protein